MAARNSIFNEKTKSSYGWSNNITLSRKTKANINLLQRLELSQKIEQHTGCVNTICWNESGDYLLSGSDDQNLCVTNPFTNQVIASVHSGHRANIFSAKFLPNTRDRHIVSCSGDGLIHFNNLDRSDAAADAHRFNCHFGTVYEIVTVPNDAHSFVSCGEDGTVRWFDLRLKSNCSKEDCKEDILINCRRAVTALAVNPMKPFELAVGCSDSSVRIFDRRMLGTRISGSFTGRGLMGLVTRFAPEQLESRAHRITSLQYSEDGCEVLTSYSSEYVYLFDIRRQDTSRKFHGAEGSRSSSQEDSSENGVKQPPIKRLRLRGDWSDTGPQARPERERGETDRGTVTIMQRMSDMLTRWLEGVSNQPTNQVRQEGVVPDQPANQQTSDDDDVTNQPTNQQASSDVVNSQSENNRTEESNHCDEEVSSSTNHDTAGQVSSNYSNNSQSANQDDATNLCKSTQSDSQSNNNVTTSTDCDILDLTDKSSVRENEDPVSVSVTESNMSKKLVLETSLCKDDCHKARTTVSETERCNERPSQRSDVVQNQTDNINSPVSSCESKVEFRSDENSSAKSDQNSKISHESTLDEASEIKSVICESRSSPCQTSGDDKDKNTNSSTADDTNESKSNVTSRQNEVTESQRHMKTPVMSDTRDQDVIRPLNVEPVISLEYHSQGTTSSTISVDFESISLESRLQPMPAAVSNVQIARQASPPIIHQHQEEQQCKQREQQCHKEANQNNRPLKESNHEKCSRSDFPKQQHAETKSTTETSESTSAECKPCLESVSEVATSEETEKRKSVTMALSASTAEDKDIKECSDDQESVCKASETHQKDSQQTDQTQCSSSHSNVGALNEDEASPRPQTSQEEPGDGPVIDREHVSGSASAGQMENPIETVHLQGVPSVSGVSRRVRRIGLSGPPTGESQPFEEPNQQEPGEDSEDELRSAFNHARRARSDERDRAARRLQELFRRRQDERERQEQEMMKVQKATLKTTFKGHRNARTMIKEACFWGDDFVMSGSDCGHIFVWDRYSARLVMLLEADRHVVNCVRPHPYYPILASSGIDYDIKIWTPTSPEPCFQAVKAEELRSRNEVMLEETRDTITVPASFMLRMLASLNHMRAGRRAGGNDSSATSSASEED